MGRKIFIWVGNPQETSLCHGLADAFQKGTEAQGADIRRMQVRDMQFDPDLSEGYNQRKTLEPCLEEWRDNITWADHLCWIYPQWWGGMPAKMKGVVDRAFLPGFAMEYHTNDPFWDPLLKGRTADLIMTADTPAWYDQILYGRPAMKQARRLVLNFSGIRPVRTLQVGTVKGASDKKLQKWLTAAEKRGIKAGRT